MTGPPTLLAAASFAMYPRQGRALALAHLALLQRVPTLFAAVLLREIIGYDWKFPAESTRIENQLRVLESLSPQERDARLQGFGGISLSGELKGLNWIADPAAFMEQLTAWLWSSGQMDSFRAAAEDYGVWLDARSPAPRPAMRRMALISIGRGTGKSSVALFRKLRPHGLYLTNVQPEEGWAALQAEAVKRAASASDLYSHWRIDGGVQEPTPHLAQISYADLLEPRAQLLARIQQAIDSGNMGPEKLRSIIARLQPEEIGLASAGSNEILDRFKLSLLTEGSGTQIFSTTFVQWAARECLRRAEPATLLMRYAPRQQMQPMNAMLTPGQSAPVDPEASLVDADMGAYYTWINMNRLPGADQMSFLAWHEGSTQALAIGPGLPSGTTSDSALSIARVLALVS